MMQGQKPSGTTLPLIILPRPRSQMPSTHNAFPSSGQALTEPLGVGDEGIGGGLEGTARVASRSETST